MKEIYKLARSCKTFDEFQKLMNPDPIIRFLSSTGFTIDQLRSKSKKRELVDMRRILSFWLFKNNNYSKSDIALVIRRDRTTVHYYLDMMDSLLDYDPLFREKFNKVIHN